MRFLIESLRKFGYTTKWMTSGDKKGRSPLIIGSMHGYVKVVELIIREIINCTDEEMIKKMYIDFQDFKGRTSLFYAVADGHLSVARLLVEFGADLDIATNTKHTQPGSTPLMATVERNHLECFEFLLEQGANIRAIRQDGADFLYIAARYGRREIFERMSELDEFSFLVNRPTFRRRTVIIPAASHGHILVCKIILQAMKNINHRDIDGNTALMYSAIKGNLSSVKWLISYGANIHLKNKSKERALDYAIYGRHEDVIHLLKKLEKKQNKKDVQDVNKTIVF